MPRPFDVPDPALNQIEILRQKRRIAIEVANAKFLRQAFWLSLILTFACYFLHGFGLFGFQLSEGLLRLLGGATIGQIVTLLSMVIKKADQ